MVDHIFLLKK